MANSTPLIGGWVATAMFAGTTVTGQTVTRMYFLHVFILPVVVTTLILAHLFIVWAQGMRSHTEVDIMGMMERFGRIADTYISERDKLLEADKERRRTFTGHPFWPTEVLRDTIIFASIVMTIAFYSWLIPPPLHSAADPFAQAGFVFPDWYVLFSYGYLRWGEYLLSSSFLPALLVNS